VSTKFRGKKQNSPLFEIAPVFVRFDHVARSIVKRGSQHHVKGCCALASSIG
jgi:hypothetical protein